MSIEDRVRELNGGTYTKNYSVRGSSVNLGIPDRPYISSSNRGVFSGSNVQTGYRIIKTSFDKWLDNE